MSKSRKPPKKEARSRRVGTLYPYAHRAPILRALRASAKNDYQFDGPHTHLLERFRSPDASLGNSLTHPLELSLDVPEFTSLCPITGQPDYAKLHIHICPRDWCVESKSLKLYLMSFRQAGAFHEECCARIVRDLVELLKPARITVSGTFGARGGIAFNPTINWMSNESWKR